MRVGVKAPTHPPKFRRCYGIRFMELSSHSLDKRKEKQNMDIVIYDLPLVVGLISLTVVIVKVLAYKASKQGE